MKEPQFVFVCILACTLMHGCSRMSHSIQTTYKNDRLYKEGHFSIEIPSEWQAINKSTNNEWLFRSPDKNYTVVFSVYRANRDGNFIYDKYTTECVTDNKEYGFYLLSTSNINLNGIPSVKLVFRRIQNILGKINFATNYLSKYNGELLVLIMSSRTDDSPYFESIVESIKYN